ncbi:MAG TPA: thioredoxin family protein [Gemmatales bacterium]|nr:thioredoxin family protein [Gemmatales bacterium]
MSDGNRLRAVCLGLMLTFMPASGTVQALPHLYYDDLGLINWYTSWPAALQEARLTGKMLYIQFTPYPCQYTETFCKTTMQNEKVQKALRQHCVCLVVDTQQIHPELYPIYQNRVTNRELVPVHLFLSPSKEQLWGAVQSVGPDIMLTLIGQCAQNKNMRMTKPQEKEVEKLNQSLPLALQNKDARQIQQIWQAIRKIPGFSDAKTKSYDLLDAAEEPARRKLYEAAKLLREQKQPLAQLALDEAKGLAESLPIATEIAQTSAALKLFDSALEMERLATSTKQKQQALTQFQQLLTKYPETTVATLAYQKLRYISIGK